MSKNRQTQFFPSDLTDIKWQWWRTLWRRNMGLGDPRPGKFVWVSEAREQFWGCPNWIKIWKKYAVNRQMTHKRVSPSLNLFSEFQSIHQSWHFHLKVSRASQNKHIPETSSWSSHSRPPLLVCYLSRMALNLPGCIGRIAGVILDKILFLTTFIVDSFLSLVDSSL